MMLSSKSKGLYLFTTDFNNMFSNFTPIFKVSIDQGHIFSKNATWPRKKHLRSNSILVWIIYSNLINKYNQAVLMQQRYSILIFHIHFFCTQIDFTLVMFIPVPIIWPQARILKNGRGNDFLTIRFDFINYDSLRRLIWKYTTDDRISGWQRNNTKRYINYTQYQLGSEIQFYFKLHTYSMQKGNCDIMGAIQVH